MKTLEFGYLPAFLCIFMVHVDMHRLIIALVKAVCQRKKKSFIFYFILNIIILLNNATVNFPQLKLITSW